MKNILISIRPQYVAKILNKEKTIEVRKKFPKDYVGWVYIYVTKGKQYLSSNSLRYYVPKKYEKYMGNCNGKVVARFWCDKVGEFYDFDDDLCEQACLDRGGMLAYLGDKKGYAIHITKLEIFDKPKEISEFKRNSGRIGLRGTENGNELFNILKPVEHAPQSWCYIEV